MLVRLSLHARRVASAFAVGCGCVVGATAARAQVVPPARPAADTASPPAASDSVRARGPRQARAGAAPRPGLRPPVTPRQAFLSSLLLPGLGQSRLGRPTAGAVFAGVEMGSLAMLVKSLGDLRAAKAFRADSVPTVFPVDSLGRPIAPTAQSAAPFSNELVRARRLHLEDWIAALIFNHLISGAEAFVSANLYDLPAQISARPAARGGGTVAVSVAW